MPSKSKERSLGSPRGYLSHSQLQLWERDQNEYYNRYIEGIEQPRTAYLELGHRLAVAMENGKDEGDDPAINHLVLFLPTYQEKEYEIKAKFEGIPLLGKLDSFDPKGLRIREYKTGKNKWTQRMVDEHGQLTFYALLVWLKYKKFPSEIHLDWAETKEEDGDLFLTGEYQTFSTKRTLKDLILMGGRIEKAWKGIGEMMESIKL